MLAGDHVSFGVLGVPIDNLGLHDVVAQIDMAALQRRRMFISTINTNFIVNSQTSEPFRSSLLFSDLCTVDGVGVMIVCKLLVLGTVPRVSGADILEYLRTRASSNLDRPLRIFFLGGAEGVAEAARRVTNASSSSAICCVGALNPGFGSIDDLSRTEVVQKINDAHPDILVVALGAERGQAWLLKNAAVLTVPVCTHFGAAVNFLAGTVKRAPRSWQILGLEWLWRIRQEPHLAMRYWKDGKVLARLTIANVIPMAAIQAWDRMIVHIRPKPLTIEAKSMGGETVLAMTGAAMGAQVAAMRRIFRTVLEDRVSVTLDLEALCAIDIAAIGEIMRLRRDLEARGCVLRLSHIPAGIWRRLRFDAAGWLS